MTALKQFVTNHPRLTAWIALAIGMVAILAWSARDVGLIWTQWLALILATIGLAGLCVWIIGWEDESAEDAGGEAGAPSEPPAAEDAPLQPAAEPAETEPAAEEPPAPDDTPQG